MAKAEYFPHDMNARDDPKVMVMMTQLGIEAYGIYWVLIEYLRSQKDYMAPKILIDALSGRYGSSREKFEAVITNYSLFEFDDKNFWSPSLIRRMLPLDEKREKMRQLALNRWDDASVMRTHSAGNAQVMQSKSKSKSKSKNNSKSIIKEKITLSPLSLLNVDHGLVKKWGEWVEFREKLKKPYRTQEGIEASFRKLMNLSGNDPDHAIAIIQQSIDNEWQGFFELKTPIRKTEGNALENIINDLRGI
ncbi:MAG TPA: DUF4373 domain-containing protein [Bacteroidales bacterium]|nr:DUF4373 domain-containing protein [Bacteroidales bacterium]HOG56609.1 DUF4373 domain-containing protein [Bacteroidales bacterium]